jgi:signal transduction histidine kinase
VLSGARSVLCAPIVVRGRPAACLYLGHRQLGGLFGDGEERVATLLAALAGAAIENALANEELRLQRTEVRRLGEAVVRGQEAERRNLSLALHDGAGQSLTALGLRLADLARRQSEPALAAEIAGMRGAVLVLLEEIRRLSLDLRPSALDRLGLPDALRDLAEGMSGSLLLVEFSAAPAGFPILSQETADHLFRVAQAALTNVALHARAASARLTLTATPGSVRLEVEDDGVGFDPALPDPVAGIGLIGMRERAAWLGGSFVVDAAPGRGTRVCIEVPCRRPAGPAVT